MSVRNVSPQGKDLSILNFSAKTKAIFRFQTQGVFNPSLHARSGYEATGKAYKAPEQ